MQTILIIGGGNMGATLAQRWRDAFPDRAISVIDPNTAIRQKLTRLKIQCYASLPRYRGTPSLVVLAVKPQSAPEVLAQLKSHRARYHSAVLVSVMAGISLKQLAGISTHAVRVMPNMPARIGEGMSVLCAPKAASALRHALTQLFSALGAVAWVESEQELHAVTAISGSGPAYVFAFMEALMKAAESLGLNSSTARLLVTQTVRGAALLADHSRGEVSALRHSVTSPKGTTEAALKIFKKAKLNQTVKSAAKAAEKRSKKLSKINKI